MGEVIRLPVQGAAELGRPCVKRARTATRSAAWRARRTNGQPQRNWLVTWGSLQLVYSSHSTAIDGALLLGMWRMISPVGLVGVNRLPSQ